MAGRHQGQTPDFHDPDFAEQAKSITTSIEQLQAAIEHHIERSPSRQETVEKCLAQIDRLRQHLKSKSIDPREGAATEETTGAANGVHKFYVASPRLAHPERAADFVKEVIEEPHNAGLR
jgi:hypothetical protein